jgi:hypothetical protein
MSICPDFEFNKFCTNGSLFSKYYEYAYVVIEEAYLMLFATEYGEENMNSGFRSTVLTFWNKLISNADEKISTKELINRYQ